MQLSHQTTPPLTPISSPPFVWRHSRKPITPSTLASFSFGDSPGGRSRPPSQLHGHGPFHQAAHRPLPQKFSHSLSRSSSSLSLLSLSTNHRNAVYIDEMIDIDSGADDYGVESGEGDRLQARNEEGYHTLLIPPTNTLSVDGVHFNAHRSSQVYLGIGTNTEIPTRPPPAPPLVIDADEKGGLGGVGVIDEDTIEEKNQLPQQYFEMTDVEHHESDFDTDMDVNLHNEHDYSEGFMSRWSLTSSIGEIPTFAGGGGTFGVGSGGGGLFGSKKRMSLAGDKIDKTKGIDEGRDAENEEEKAAKFAERLGSMENEKEKGKNGAKKKGRLVSFISRISSNMIASPSPPAASQITTVIRSSSY